MYASFVQEMTAVQEAFDTWKASKKIDDLEDVSLPTVSMVEVATMEKSPRFMGEVGYYRTWTISNKKPEKVSITSNPGDFKTAYSSELVFYPAGVQDLYYLDNKVLDIKTNKKYIIDAQNSMIYSVSGANIGGIEVHSLHMAQMIRGGATDTPQFAEAEGDGGGNIVYAGSEYYMDKDGHYLDANGNIVDESEKIINPYGFKIIADVTNDNIYKLYNNGDLYGKGVKGPLLNTPEEEMEKINPYKWSKLTIPSVIPGYNTNNIQVVMGSDTIYVIDSNKDLWAWGNNNYNKLGLNDYQLKEFTGVEATKLNIGGSYDENNNIIGSKKVYKVFPTYTSTFVVTETNGVYELYSSGCNEYGELGTGKQMASSDSFEKVIFEYPEKIENILNCLGTNIIFCNLNDDLKVFFCGFTHGSNVFSSGEYVFSNFFKNTNYKDKHINNFIEISNGEIGIKPPTNIKSYISIGAYTVNPEIIAIGDNGKAFFYNLLEYKEIYTGDDLGNIIDGSGAGHCVLLKKELNNNEIEYWGYCTDIRSSVFPKSDIENEKSFLVNEFFPEDVSIENINSFKVSYDTMVFTTKDGRAFGCGSNINLGINSPSDKSNSFINIGDELENVRISSISWDDNTLLSDTYGNIYLTNMSKIVFRENILQENWKLIATDVKKFNATTGSNCLAYIDKNNDLWVVRK